MMISLPNLHKSKGLKAWRFITQFYIGKDLRSTEGMDIKSEPWVTVVLGSGIAVYALIAGGFSG